MAVPKVIYQTFKHSNLPFINRFYINRIRRNNPDYDYEFYDDEKIDKFIKSEYSGDLYEAYKRIQIGAAKADFFRYAILYKRGGIYLDIDSNITKPLDSFILPDEKALITHEDHRDPPYYVQWALIYEEGHIFLKRTLELILENIKENKFPHDVSSMTGPGVYSEAITQCLKENPGVQHRLLGIDFNNNLSFQFPLSKFFLYKKGEHWKKQQLSKPVIKYNIEN